MGKKKPRCGQVVTYCCQAQMTPMANTVNGDSCNLVPGTHESVTRSRMAEKLAALKGFEYAGEYRRAIAYDSLYFVPSDTLLLEQARQLGIANTEHLFGGCVSEPFIATKSITHPLFSAQASAPPGWVQGFARDVARVALRGYSAFSIADARAATAKLLNSGGARLKPALGVGGGGQSVITHMDEFDAAIAAIDPDELGRYGVVIEQNLEKPVTYSVGCAQVAGIEIAYYGTQSLTRNHRDENVYGGSSLHVVRGNFQTLQAMAVPPEIAGAIEQACVYDQAAQRNLPGFFASRRNYDVVQGMDRYGHICAGVLEQSWRIGGASPAEIAAMEAFAADSRLRAVQVATCERYGIGEPPAAASVHFRGIDGRVGAIAKYTVIEAREYSTDSD